MENTPLPFKPDQILQIIIKKRWFIILPFLVSVMTGCYLAVTLPKVYESKTSILVQPQKVPGSFVKSIVSSSINSRISTISQQILSRTNLEKIINQFQLFSGEKEKNMFLEDKVIKLRKDIGIKLTHARSGSSAFTISYRGNPPERVMQVANTLTSFFMDENLKIREAQAIGTSNFLDSELEKTLKKLETHEREISTYRARHLGELPEELDSNLRALDRLQEQLSSKQAALINTRRMLSVLKSNSSQAFQVQGEAGNLIPQKNLTETEQALLNARKHKDQLLLRYTTRHPDVLKMQKAIETLEVQVTAGTPGLSNQDLSSAASSPGKSFHETQLEQLQFEINKLKKDINLIEKSMITYQKRVDETPKREQELLSLQRDYSNIKSVYSSLLSRKLEAEIAVNMEKKQKGEQFRILDFARLPNKPISPDLKKIMIMSLIVGLGIGCGLVFLMEFLNTSLKDTDDMESYLESTVLATIPQIQSARDIRWMRINYALSLAAFLLSIAFVCCLALFAFKGVDQTIDLMKYPMQVMNIRPS